MAQIAIILRATFGSPPGKLAALPLSPAELMVVVGAVLLHGVASAFAAVGAGGAGVGAGAAGCAGM